MFKIIIAGSREFNDYNLLKSKLDLLTSQIKDEIEIVSYADACVVFQSEKITIKSL